MYGSTGSGEGTELWRVSVPGGSPQRLAATGANAGYPTIARQGNRLAYVQAVQDINIWRVELDRSPDGETSEAKLIASTRNDRAARISSDGKRIAFVSDRSGNREIPRRRFTTSDTASPTRWMAKRSLFGSLKFRGLFLRNT